MNDSYTFFFNKTPFSQFYPCTFTVGNIKYFCAEQFMMASKAELFGDQVSLKKILLSKSAKECKALGKEVKNFNKGVWEKQSFGIVYKGNYFKFVQNPKLFDKLLETAGTTLVEASPYDRIWGIGLSADDPRALRKETWLGENRLGNVLTRLRDDFIKEMKV